MQITFENLPQAVTELQHSVNNILRLLEEKSNEQNPQSDQLLTVKQASALLSLSVPTLYGYTQRAEIPFSKKGKRLYFSKQDLTLWIKEGRKKTIAEINADASQYLKPKRA